MRELSDWALAAVLGRGAAGFSFLPRGSDMMQAEADMRKCYSEREIRANYEELTKLLIRKHLTITTMESATSGQDCFIDH